MKVRYIGRKLLPNVGGSITELENMTIGNEYFANKIDHKNGLVHIVDDNNDKVAIFAECFENIPAQPAQLGLDVLEIPNGIKHDSGKLKPTLLIDDMPLAIQEVLKVLKFGAEKYSEGNWLKVDNGINRYRNAADRHRLACAELDEESQLLHLAHEATSILMLLELKLRGGK